MALSTVSGILKRIGLGKLGRLGIEPAVRYERERPGELVHIDIKKLGCIEGGAGHRWRDLHRKHYTRTVTDREGVRRNTVGWEYVHVAIDDATRLAYVEVLADEKAKTAIGFLQRALKHFAAHGIDVESVITDPLHSPRDHMPRARRQTPTHTSLPPADQRQAERFIRTMLAGWAYGAIYRSSHERTAALAGWLDFYNRRRPHGAISHQPPLSRLRQLSGNNLLGSYS